MSSSPTRLTLSPRTKIVPKRKGPPGIELDALVSPGRKRVHKRTQLLRKPPGRKSTGSEDLQTAHRTEFLKQEIEFLQGVGARYDRIRALEQELYASQAEAQQLRAQVNWYNQTLHTLAENCNDGIYRLKACTSLRQSLPSTSPCEDLFQLIQKAAERLETWRLRINS